MTQPAHLIADIGGTYARFALVLADQRIVETNIIADQTLTDCVALCRRYLDGVSDRYTITRAAWAVAGPVTGDQVLITNRGWRFSCADIQRTFGWDDFSVINDFAALALALPHLDTADKILIKPGQTDRSAPLVVTGPGTGLGVAGLVPLSNGGWQVLPGEGGHVALPTVNSTEAAILTRLQQRFPYVPAEQVLSGRGLVNLYAAMAVENDVLLTTPEAIAIAAQQENPLAIAVLQQFCDFLGTVAGDAALTFGARGGVYLAGGILPQIVETLQASDFTSRFTARNAVESYLTAIPVWLITDPLPAFKGLRSLLV